MIIQTVNAYDFERAFIQAGRKDQFSYEGLRALFDYLDEVSDDVGAPYELDVISICCDWTESDWQTIAQDYNLDLSEHKNDDDKIEAVDEYLSDHTQMIRLPTDNFVYQSF